MSNKRILAGIVAFLVAGLLFTTILAPRANAAYEAGRIIDDALFLDAKSMSAADIQNFLAARGSGLRNMSFVLQCYGSGSQERQWYTAAGARCDTPIPASEIIYYAAQVYGVNPKVILATMQKEQSLTTAANPTVWQLTQAMGYACPTSGSCSSSSSFPYQIDSGTWALRFHYERARGNMNWWYTSTSWTCGSAKSLYNPNLYPGQNVRFFDTNGTHYATIYIQNAATSTMYCYTPHAYNNPQGLYGRAPYGNTGLYYSGSYNFVYFYELWFGSTYATVFNGINYAPVFNADYYLNRYPDLKSAFGNDGALAFRHFVSDGMAEGRQASESFDVISYKNRYQDLRFEFGAYLPSYYAHYAQFGGREGRIGTGPVTITHITSYKNINYSAVYDFTTYRTKYSDINRLFGNDDAGAMIHFATYGIREGRTGSTSFDANSYRNRYPDLRRVFGSSLELYYLHYIQSGKAEGRLATGNYYGGTSYADGVNYSAVYDFNSYFARHSDVRTTYGLDDINALQHFITFGMKEGRQASDNFNVQSYRTRYADLRAVFGNDLKAYYTHYLTYGVKEGRVAN